MNSLHFRMNYHVKYNDPFFTNFRKNLRNNSTSAEACLWFYLKQKKIEGRKFTRQKSIGNFIIDFYCHDKKLAIELDGSFHDKIGQLQIDAYKDNKLRSLGLKILRIEADRVYQDMPIILAEIETAVKTGYICS